MTQIALMGDSIFDNAPYVAAGGDVLSQLRALSPPGQQVALLARDGDTLADMVCQFKGLRAL